MIMHPPANRRCQIYSSDGTADRNLYRCLNEGDHWEKWGSGEDDFYSWECDGEHDIREEVPA